MKSPFLTVALPSIVQIQSRSKSAWKWHQLKHEHSVRSSSTSGYRRVAVREQCACTIIGNHQETGTGGGRRPRRKLKLIIAINIADHNLESREDSWCKISVKHATNYTAAGVPGKNSRPERADRKQSWRTRKGSFLLRRPHICVVKNNLTHQMNKHVRKQYASTLSWQKWDMFQPSHKRSTDWLISSDSPTKINQSTEKQPAPIHEKLKRKSNDRLPVRNKFDDLLVQEKKGSRPQRSKTVGWIIIAPQTTSTRAEQHKITYRSRSSWKKQHTHTHTT